MFKWSNKKRKNFWMDKWMSEIFWKLEAKTSKFTNIIISKFRKTVCLNDRCIKLCTRSYIKEIGEDLPISYESKTLGKHDLNKLLIEKELLAIHWGIEFFRPYIFGRKFIVVSDHRRLISLFTHKKPSKLTRVRFELCDFFLYPL